MAVIPNDDFSYRVAYSEIVLNEVPSLYKICLKNVCRVKDIEETEGLEKYYKKQLPKTVFEDLVFTENCLRLTENLKNFTRSLEDLDKIVYDIRSHDFSTRPYNFSLITTLFLLDSEKLQKVEKLNSIPIQKELIEAIIKQKLFCEPKFLWEFKNKIFYAPFTGDYVEDTIKAFKLCFRRVNIKRRLQLYYRYNYNPVAAPVQLIHKTFYLSRPSDPNKKVQVFCHSCADYRGGKFAVVNRVQVETENDVFQYILDGHLCSECNKRLYVFKGPSDDTSIYHINIEEVEL